MSYIGTKNLVDVGVRAGCERLVRVSGLSVGLPAFSPLSFFLNFFLSMTIR